MTSTRSGKVKHARSKRASGGKFGYTPGKSLDELRPIPPSVPLTHAAEVRFRATGRPVA